MDLNDYRLMLSIIDNVALRGAIRGDEMFEVGQLRAKLTQEVTKLEDKERKKFENETG